MICQARSLNIVNIMKEDEQGSLMKESSADRREGTWSMADAGGLNCVTTYNRYRILMLILASS